MCRPIQQFSNIAASATPPPNIGIECLQYMNLIALYSRVIDRIDNIIRISVLRSTQARNTDTPGIVTKST